MERGWEFSDSDTDCDLETQPVVKKQRTVVEYSDSDTDLSTDDQSFEIESQVEILSVTPSVDTITISSESSRDVDEHSESDEAVRMECNWCQGPVTISSESSATDNDGFSSDSENETDETASKPRAFSLGAVKYNAGELVRIMLDEKHHDKVIKQQPLRVHESKSFVVDTKYLNDPDDIKADDLGSWRNDGQHSRWVKVKQVGGHVRAVEFCSGKPKGDPATYCLHRLYYIHHSNDQFKRKIAYLTDHKGNRHNLTFVQYISPSPYLEVDIKPHGNANSSEPYLRSSQSTLKSLKTAVKNLPPKEAVEKVSKEKGGEMSAKSAGSLPRNRQQAYNIAKLKKNEDPLYSLIIDSQNLQQAKDQFVREVKLAPEPCVVMGMDYQIADLDAFCTQPDYHCVFGVDPTFDLGNFNLTVTTYKQLQLMKPNGESPTFIGPLFLHYRKTFSCYHSFSSGLLGLNKNLANICAFGTDGEVALIDAFKQQCHSAVHLMCFNHCRENIKRKLRELNVPPLVASDYIFDIFGGQRGPTFVEGLVDVDSECDFDQKLAAFKDAWNPQFFEYFLRNKADVMKESMIKPVRIKAGLGNPPDQYHNNAPECMNNVIKAKVHRKKQNSLDEICSQLRSLVEDQQNHLVRAITRRGEYRLRSIFKKFEMSPLKWFELSEQDRSKHIHQLQKVAGKYMARMCTSESSVSPSPSLMLETNSSNREASVSVTHSASAPSVTVTSQTSHSGQKDVDKTLAAQICRSTTIPASSINGIWDKAQELLRDPYAITPAPVKGQARMVKSISQPCRPHLVQIMEGGKVVCDENCPMWVSLKICSHCVAVAHSIGNANEYALWFSANAQAINLTKLTTQKVSRDVGKKPRNRYSQQKGKKKQIPITARTPSLSSSVSLSMTNTSVATQLSTNSSWSDTPPHLISTYHNATPTPLVTSPIPTQLGFSPNLIPSQPSYSSTPMPSQAGFSPMPSSQLPTPTQSGSNLQHTPTQTQFGLSYALTSTPLGFTATPTSLSYTPVNNAAPLTQSRVKFWVCKLNNRITTCYGCRGKFLRGADGHIPVPPLDLILKCCETREYFDKAGNKQKKDNCNTYYHPSVSCIRAKHPDFQLGDIALQDSLRSTLLQSHLQLLECAFNFHP